MTDLIIRTQTYGESPIDYTGIEGTHEIVWSNKFAAMKLVPSVNGPHICVVRGDGEVALGAAALIFDGYNILMVHQNRWALGYSTWEIPMGGVDAGETPEYGAVRELREETGLIIEESDLQPLGLVRAEGTRTNGETHTYFVQLDTPQTAVADLGELIELAWIPADIIVNACISGEIKDPTTLATVMRARLTGLI